MMDGTMGGGAAHYLEVLQRDQATGEFVAASRQGELRVFFQQGRVAWATSSQQSRRAFRETLVRECGVQPQALADLIAEARTRRLHIADLLVQRGVATPEQVRRALRAQVLAAMRDLDRMPTPHVRFLPQEQALATYDAGLTFELKELLPERFDQRGATETYRRAVSALPALRCSACVDGGAVARATGGHPPREVLDWHAALQGTAATQLVLRSDHGVVAGCRLTAADSSLWGCLAEAEQLPQALEVLANVAPPSGAPPRLRLGRGALVSGGQVPAYEAVLRALVERDPDVAAAVTTTRVGPGFALGPSRAPFPAWLPRAWARAHLFDGFDIGPDADRHRFPVAGLEDEFGWWFGIPFGDPMPGTLWALAQPDVSVGMGFALVRQLRRRLLQASQV